MLSDEPSLTIYDDFGILYNFFRPAGNGEFVCLFVLWALILCEHWFHNENFSNLFALKNWGKELQRNGGKNPVRFDSHNLDGDSQNKLCPLCKQVLEWPVHNFRQFFTKIIQPRLIFFPKLAVIFFGRMPSAPCSTNFWPTIVDSTKTISSSRPRGPWVWYPMKPKILVTHSPFGGTRVIIVNLWGRTGDGFNFKFGHPLVQPVRTSGNTHLDRCFLRGWILYSSKNPPVLTSSFRCSTGTFCWHGWSSYSGKLDSRCRLLGTSIFDPLEMNPSHDLSGGNQTQTWSRRRYHRPPHSQENGWKQWRVEYALANGRARVGDPLIVRISIRVMPGVDTRGHHVDYELGAGINK